MYKKVLPALLLFLMLGGCKKQSTSGSNIIKEENVADYTNGSTSGVNTLFTYDAHNRLITTNSTTIGSIVTYNYSQDSITRNQTISAGFLYSPVTYYLNQQGYAVSDNEGDVFTYDSSWHLLSQITTAINISDTSLYTYQNGNLITTNFMSHHGGVNSSSQTTYTYFSNKDNRNTLLPFLGKGSVNLVATINYSPGNGVPENWLTYTFDDQSRVITETTTWTSNGVTPGKEVVTYTYF